MSKSLREKKLEAIENLLKRATDSEIEYLNKLKSLYNLDDINTSKDNNKDKPSLKDIIDRGFVGLHFYQFERDRSPNKSLLRDYFEEKYSERLLKLRELIQDYEREGNLYSTPEYSEDNEKRKFQIEEIEGQIHETECLIGVRTAWLERSGRDLNDEKLIKYSHRLSELRSALQAVNNPT